MALQLRPRYRRIAANPSLLRLCSFSSSSSSPNPNQSDPFLQNPTNDDSSSSSPDPSLSSQFSDVKSSLNHRRPATAPPSFSRTSATPPPSKAASLAEISRNLSQFRSSTAAPSAGDSNSASSSPISFQALYQKNLSNKDGGTGTASFDMIRSSLRTMKREGTGTGTERGERRETQVRNVESRVVGGSEALPMSVFGKELGERKLGGGGGRSEATRTLFVNMYNPEELGKKLRMLKPEGAEKSGFSLTELTERLNKVREMDEEQTESRGDGVPYSELRAGLLTMSNEKGKANKTPIRLNVLGGLGGTPDYMVLPPKEHLVEKYFHPDNMSAAEKLKLELQKVREEFKMSESDCGSARVQVAQLTIKIKHLSSLLHKKDKHSRKGLVEMVQRRKKLLKYLRRTDWDSYCFVLSKLGLRDNPDYKR